MSEERSVGDDSAAWASLFWTAFDGSANPMVLVDHDRVIVAVNDAALEALGYTRSEVVGRTTTSYVDPDHWSRMDEDWRTIAQTGRVARDRDLVRADGRRVRIQFAAQEVTVGARHLVLCVVLDLRLRPLSLDGRVERSPDALSRRELEVVSEIAMGQRAQQIAGHLQISDATVRTHVRNAMAKVGARSQAQLVAIALASNTLDADLITTKN